MTTEKDKSNLPATTKQEATAVDAFDPSILTSFAGAGLENASVEDFAIPFIFLLQKMSPQADADADGYVEGAKPGMFLNTVTRQLWDGDKGLRVVPIHFEKTYVEWVPRDEGGGWVATHHSREEAERNRSKERTTEIVDTASHYVLVEVAPGEWEPAIIPCTSTKLKASREWMSAMSRVVIQGPNGKFVAPSFSKIWTIRSVSQKKDKYTYFNFTAALEEGWVDQATFEVATRFREQVLSGARKADFSKADIADAEIVEEDRPSF